MKKTERRSVFLLGKGKAIGLCPTMGVRSKKSIRIGFLVWRRLLRQPAEQVLEYGDVQLFVHYYAGDEVFERRVGYAFDSATIFGDCLPFRLDIGTKNSDGIFDIIDVATRPKTRASRNDWVTACHNYCFTEKFVMVHLRNSNAYERISYLGVFRVQYVMLVYVLHNCRGFALTTAVVVYKTADFFGRQISRKLGIR